MVVLFLFFAFHMEKVNIRTTYSKGFYHFIYPITIPWSASIILQLAGIFEITIEYGYSMVPFSVLVVCDVIVFMELPISEIFKGTLKVCHSK